MGPISSKKKREERKNKRHREPKDGYEVEAVTAHFYGFTPIPPVKVEKEDMANVKTFLEIDIEKEIIGKKSHAIHPEEKIALLRGYMDENLYRENQPSLYYQESYTGSKRKGDSSSKQFHLDIIGTTKSIAEAIVIKTAVEILKDEGFKNIIIELNSIGDKESTARFLRDLQTYYRKNISLLPAHCKQTLKNDPFELFSCDNEKCMALMENAPSAVSSLSENSRRHFSEVLEYLESLKIPYRINTRLLLNRKLCSGTLFEIKDADTNTTLALGGRYNGVSKRMGSKKECGAITLFASWKKTKTAEKKIKRIKPPKLYFIQLGFNAKLKSLDVIEILRKERIPISQALAKDKLSPQLQVVENMKIPYVLIMGQKEAMEESVIVRDMVTRCQETVPIKNLSAYLKKIK